jgi:hypothetical protein
MTYTQQQIDAFWWGPGGSASNPQPGAYVLMNQGEVIALSNCQSAAYNASWAALLDYLYCQAVLKKSGIGPTGSNGFADTSTIGGKTTCLPASSGTWWIGPTKS